MPGRIRDADIQQLRDRADLGSIAAEYTSLKRAGSKLKGLCPFHDEKTPSFTIDPAKNLFHCFGCQEGGDVYDFLQKAEALTFPESVERLARMVGHELTYEELSPGQRRALGRRTRLLEVLAEAADYYQRQLRAPEGEPARNYLASRGVGEEATQAFALGWAPDAWDALVRHLQGAGFEPDEMAAAGLATRGRQGLIDRFRGRVIFPIYERAGRDVVAFGGRVIPGLTLGTAPRSGDPPKYINSPETDVYRKSEVLYGLNWARAEIQARQSALVVEGYMDVIGLHLAGMRHAVATCGTALTVEHFRQLEKYSPRMVLALDADDAGFAAADRARAMAEEAGVREVGVMPLPVGTDPADLAAAGPEKVEEALQQVQTAVEFQITHLLRTADTDTPEGQVDAYRRTFPLLARLDDRMLRYRYIRDIVAPAVRLSADLIEQELDAEVNAAASPTAAAAGPPEESRATPQVRLEREVLRAAIQAPELLPVDWQLVTRQDFTTEPARQLFSALGEAHGGDLQAVLDALPNDEARARVRGLALSDSTIEADKGHVAELVSRLRAATLTRQIDGLREQLERLNQDTDPQLHRKVFTDLIELERRRRDLVEGLGS